jgi:hypothetical protein
VTDAQGRVVFESGAFSPDGRIVGNDNDEDGSRYEPHHDRIESADQVQIYEAIMADDEGRVTTGLMSATRWLKENRLLPKGFDADRGGSRVAVRGDATADSSFGPGGDRIRYSVPASGTGPFTVDVELWFQPVAYRWAENLGDYDTFETQRFVGYYRAMARGSALPIGAVSRTVE